jgi:hypothetical protein
MPFRLFCLRAASCGLVLFFAPAARAATFYLDAAKTNAAQCGTQPQTACATYRYWYASGCDADGCGNNVAPGDVISFRAGTYRGDGAGGYLGIPFNGTAAAPITLACADAPGSCIISGSGVSAINWCALVGVGLLPGQSYCATDHAAYVRVRGFRLQQIPAGMYGMYVTGGSHHVAVADTTIDGGGANHSLLIAQKGAAFVTLKHSTLSNCPAADTGCTYMDTTTNLAEVGNTFGPVAASGNFDCNTMLGVAAGLLDGNTCTGSADGFDEGMHDATRLSNVIVRYNRVSGVSSRAFPLSGDRKDSGTHTGQNIFYKNVAHPSASGQTGRALELYEGAEGIDVWYNTFFASNTAGWGDVLWLNARGDYSSYVVRSIKLRYNAFDTKSTSGSALIVLDQDAATVSGCPAAAPCPLSGNALWMQERGGAAACMHWDPSDQVLAAFTCDQFGTLLNGAVHQANVRANPFFVDRTRPDTLANLKLTAASVGHIDRGQSFCRATSSASGNVIPVTCAGVSTDPRHYFPDPARFYDLADDDCRGRGVRAADGVDTGCYSVQIQGACGIRQISAMSATSITIGGAPCAWTNGAMVHVPWNGAAPDLGALELAATAPPPPTLISVEPVP